MTEIERDEMTILDRHQLMSFLLGLAHGGISAILGSSAEDRYSKLLELHNKLSSGIEILYY